MQNEKNGDRKLPTIRINTVKSDGLLAVTEWRKGKIR